LVKSFDLGTIEYLVSPEGRGACEFAASLGGAIITQIERLRSRCTPAQASAVLQTIELRAKAAKRFERADRMLFTREGLEQATSRPVAEYRAARFAGLGTVLDLCCGIGGDTIELAKQCRKVVAIDIDPVKVAIARHNVAVYGLAEKVEFHVADVSTCGFDADAVFVDPSRRVAGQRRISPSQYEPPLDVVLRLVRRYPRGTVKCAPAMDYEGLMTDASIEVVSVDRECKEVVLWFGEFASATRIQATVLPSGEHLLPTADFTVSVKPPGAYVFEPDPAVIRAHLVNELAGRFGLWKLDDSIAFMSGDHPIHSPLMVFSRVLQWLPFNLKKLNAALAALNIGRVDIKRRGFPLAPDDLKSKLKLRGDLSAVLYCCRHAGKHIVVIGGG